MEGRTAFRCKFKDSSINAYTWPAVQTIKKKKTAILT